MDSEKDILLLYNPKAGDTFFRFEIERFLETFGEMHSTIRIYRSESPGDMAKCLSRIRMEELGLVVVAGGDGTVNEVLQAMMERQATVPVGVIPAGTSNDVAHYLGMPTDYSQCIEVISRLNITRMNVGEVNGRYFLNRCGYGNLVSIYHSTSQEMKNTFGRLAYYANGMRAVPKTQPFWLKITTPDQVIEDEFIMFLVVNGEGAQIENRAFAVQAEDQKKGLQFIGIKNGSNLANRIMLMKSIRKLPKNQKSIVRFSADEFKIELPDNEILNDGSVIDGELGPTPPFTYKLHREALHVITNP